MVIGDGSSLTIFSIDVNLLMDHIFFVSVVIAVDAKSRGFSDSKHPLSVCCDVHSAQLTSEIKLLFEIKGGTIVGVDQEGISISQG